MFENNDLPPDFHAPTRNGRRGGRVSTNFWLRVAGWDSEPIVRSGDLAATGLFVTTGDLFGGPGDVAMLELESLDHQAQMRSLARVARVLRQDDRKFGARVVGIAFEFLPLETIQPAAANLVRHAVREELVRHGHVRLDDPAIVNVRAEDGSGVKTATLLGLGIEQLTLQTTTRFAYGSRFTIEVPHEGGHLKLAGEAVSSQPLVGTNVSLFSTLVHLRDAIEERQNLLVDLGQRLVVPDDYEPPPESGFDFSGELGTVSVDQLLKLVSHRCYSGVLSVGNEQQCFSIQISQGRVTSVEGGNSDSADSADSLDALRTWQSGQFRFRNRRSPRLSLISPGTAQLLDQVMSSSSSSP